MQGEFRPICGRPGPLVRPVPIDPAGARGPIRGQTQRRRWRQTTKGRYVPATVTDEVVEQRIVEQSMRLPPGGAVTGWAAQRLARAAYFDGLERDGRTRQPVPLLVPTTCRVRTLDGSVVSREPLGTDEMRLVLGIPLTLPVRAAFDEMRRVEDPREAVVALDMAAAAELVSIAEMRSYVDQRRSWRRSTRVVWALRYASERSLSPGETRMRLIWTIDAGLPRPLVNREIWDAHGKLLGKADLFDPVAGVVGEYDGATHRQARRHASDVGREDLFRRAGLEYFTVTGPDLADTDLVIRRMLSTRQRAGFLLREHAGGRSSGLMAGGPRRPPKTGSRTATGCGPRASRPELPGRPNSWDRPELCCGDHLCGREIDDPRASTRAAPGDDSGRAPQSVGAGQCRRRREERGHG